MPIVLVPSKARVPVPVLSGLLNHKTMKHAMKTTRLFLTCLAFDAIFAISPCPLKAAEKPNIIFVLFDDMGYGQPQS